MPALVTDTELATLKAARVALLRIGIRATGSGLGSDDVNHTLSCGRLCEATDTAETRVFDVLNCLHNMLDVAEADPGNYNAYALAREGA